MKNKLLFERLWEHGRTLRRVGLVLVMCLTLCIPNAWADTELVNINLSSWSTQSVSASDSVSGYYFKSASNITNGSGWVKSGNASKTQNYIGIPLSGINGSVTITVTHQSSRPTMGYELVTGNSAYNANYSHSNSMSTTRIGTNGTTTTITINNLSGSYGHLILGATGNATNGTFYISRIVVTTPAAASTKRIYMKAGAWNSDNPYFYAHSWGSSNSDVLMTLAGCETDVFYADIPSGNTSVLFTRQSTNSGIKYKNETGNWNQSADITISTNNKFTFSAWDNGSGYSTFTGGTYSAPTYTISFNGNGSTSGSTSSHTGIACNGSQTLRANGFTRTGWTFTGWNTDKYGKGTAYAAGATVSAITSNITLYAQWEKEIYLKMGSGWADANAWFAIYYYDSGADSNNGWVKMNLAESCSDPAVYKATVPGNGYNTIIFVRKNPADMTLPSWSNKWNQTTNQSLPTSNNQFTITGGSGDSYTGSWGTYSAPTYTISYAANSGSGSMSSQTGIACGTDKATTANAFTRDGYSFTGWKANVDVKVGGSTKTAGTLLADKVTIQDISSNITLTAQWEEAATCSGDPTALVSGTLYQVSDMASACLGEITSTGQYFYGLSSNGKFYINGTTNSNNASTGTVEIKTASNTIDKVNFTGIAWFKGAGTNTCRSIKFVVPSAGTLTIYGKTSSSKGNVVIKTESSGNTTVIANSVNAYASGSTTVSAGTYYVLSDGESAAIVGLKFVEESCSATQPGTIGKGTLSACTLRLTAGGSPAANNTWYWQSSADGTDKSESGATKDVTSTGTYYIRSYCTTGSGCWSEAQTVTVSASDLTPAAPTALAAASHTAKGVTLTVTDAANTNDYEFYVNTSSSAPSAGTSASYTSTSKSVTITDKYAGTTFYAWARAKCGSNKSAWTALTGSTFTTSTVSAAYHLTNVSKTSGAESGIGGSTFSAVFSANTDYSIPTPVVTIGGNAATSGTDYTWTEGTGALTIAKEKITGNIDITLNSVPSAPSSATISGAYHYFPGESISLTVTPSGNNGPTTYQWYKGGKADGNRITGATSATYTKNSCAFADAGSYYCKVTCNATSIWAESGNSYDVKILKLYVKGSKNGEDYGNVDFVKVNSTTATASIALGSGWTYGFNIADGCGHYYGNTGTMTESNHSGWTMDVLNGEDCGLTTTNAATYTFTINYSNLAAIVVTDVTYPSANQAAGKVIYFDNNSSNWENLHYRIGKTNHTQATSMTKVPGTANLYKVTTTAYDNFAGWQIGNAAGDNGSGKSIYNTKNAPAITASTAYEGGAVTADAVTVTPGVDHSTGTSSDNDNCEFYSKTITSGMKTDNVAISPYSNGTITVNYTNTSGSTATLTSGNADLAHSVILTSITAVADEGYNASAITINGGAYSANYVVTGNTTIAASFTLKTYTISYNKGTNGTGSKASETKTHGVNFTLPGSTFTYDGHAQDGWSTSDGGALAYALSGSYTTNAAQEFFPHWKCNTPTITDNGDNTVSITVPSGTTVRYTTDGTDPSSSTGTVYSSPFSIVADCTVKAIAYQSGCTDSEVVSEDCTYSGGGGDCHKYFYYATLSAPSPAPTKNEGSFFSSVPTGSGGSLSESWVIDGVTYTTSNRFSNNSNIGTFTVQSGKVATMYVMFQGSGSYTMTIKKGGSNYKTGIDAGSGIKKYTEEDMGPGTYAVTTSGNVGLLLLIVDVCDDGPDVTAPTLSSSVPANSATDIAASGNIVLTFSENVSIVDASKFTLTGGAGTLNTAGATVSGAAVTIPYSGLANSTVYTFSTAAGAVQDGSGNANAALSNIVFTTVAPAPAGGDCDMYVWFADPTTDNGGAANTDKFTTYPTASTSNMTGSFTIDEVTYSITKRRQVGSGSTIAAFTVPANHTGIYYAIIGSTGTGTRTIYLKQGETTIQTMTDAVAGSSSTGSNVTIENIAPGSYTITANNGTNVGFMGLKLCDVEACSAPTITVQPTNSADKTLGETVSFSLTATGADSYQWYRCNSSGDEMVVLSGETASSLSFIAAITGTAYYRCRALKDCGMSVLSNVVSVSVTPIEFTIHYTAGVASGTTYTTETFTASKEVNDAVETYIAESSLSKYTFTGVTFPAGANGQMSNQISMPAEYDANKYVSFTFDVASNYQIQLTNIDLQVRSSANTAENQNFKIVVSDAYGHLYTKESLSVADQSDKVQIGGDIDDATHFVGTVTVKLYGWTSDDKAYRINKDIYITGEVSSLPAPTASWTARPASATVGDGGKTYTLTTDGTNTVAWSITDQSGATDAALSPTSGLTTTLDDYSAAGSLYVQASVTGDGIHYLSTPATLLRQRVVISADCEETTLISATLSSCTGTGDVTGTPGGTSAVAFESCESLDGGYKMGKDGSYMRLALTSGNFAANDEVKITITKASDLGDGALHIYKYASSAWTELGSVVAAGAGTYTYRLTESNVSTPFNTIGLYRTGKNQNPYVKALSVVRNSCSASKPSSVTVTASPAGPYAIGATPTLTVTATNADTYQWYSNTNNTASDGFLLVGETATTYSPSTAIAGTTYYYCVATNASGSTVSNIITVTVNSAKTAPTVSWTDTYETPNYGGGGYAVKATVSTAEWDGTLTTDMLTASDGVTLTGVSVSGKVITATYGVTETARSPLSFSLTLPETTNYTALAANKEITFDRCGEGEVIATTETKLPVKSSYTTASNPTYRWETAGVGWLTLVTGSSTLSSTSDSYSGFSYRSNSGKSSITFYSELDAVSAVRIYIKGGGSTTLSKVQKGTTLGKYTQLAPSTDYDYSYSNGSSSIESREQGYIEITFKTALSANTFVEITLNRNTEYYGVGLITGNSEVGNITTAISWAAPAPDATVNKTTTDANFRYEAVKASDAASQATLGTISYKSSVPAVATVSATGVVDVLSEGTTTITATLAGSGCYKKATKSYTLNVAAATCTDLAGTIAASGTDITIDGNTVTKADACAAVTLTVSGHTGEDAGATYQWYKDGESLGGSFQTKSISVTDNGDYTVEVTNTGGVHCTMPATNTITITGNAISITKIVDEWYVKNGRRTPDIALATIEGTTSWKVNDGSADIWVVSDGVASTTTGFGECQFELRDGIVYLKGTQDDGSAPSGLAAGDVTLTITAVRDCSGASPNVSITIHKQAATVTPSIAFIVDGTKGDPVNNVATAKTSSRPIWVYLSTYFDLTGCNAYWTNNEKLIRQYYSQFDAIVITDDPSTDTKPSSGLKYVNALGTMVDVRPILTMEAYVGKYGASSNWHIGGTPSSPNPRQYELKLQCKDHDIFSDLTPSANFRSEEIDGETYYYVTMVDNSVTPYVGLADDAETETYPALQGFSAASIKGTGMLGIGTISDGTLQGGVERQDEPTARMMILGIQHQAMAALTSEGKQVIKNAINYLLKTDMEEVDDCSNYFIGTTDHEWNKASNWSSGKVPDASTKARILVPVTISTKVHVAQVDIAVDGKSIHYDSGNTNCSGSVTIASTGALIVEGQVRRTTNGRLFTEDELQPTTPADLTIQTSSSAQGALIFDNSDGETQATVVVHSSANKAGSTRNWQYLTSPLQETPVTEFFYGVGTYTYKHSEADGGWVRYNLGTTFHAFDAIGLTQEAAKDFVFYGPLAPTGEWNLSLTHTHSGNNLFGNSWTAPIDLKALVRNTDFDGNIDLDLAIYNTGVDQKNGSGEFVQAANADNTPGTWHHVPLLLATLDGGGWTGMTVIPAYQAFQLKATAAATLTIDYDKCVRGSESKNYTEPLRAPRRRSAGRADSDIEALRLAVSDAKGVAYIYLLEGEQFTEGYDNGWELSYTANSKYGKLYAISPEQGDMMALARPSLEGTMVGFQPGESSEYTITFNETDGYYYLNDLKMEQSTLIQAGESYTFSVEEGESANRFLISSVPFNKPGIVTGVTNPNAEAPKAQKVIYNDKLYIIRGGKVFSADGQLVK